MQAPSRDEPNPIARFRRRADPEAFAALYHEAAPAVRRLAARLGTPGRQVDDLAQEVCLAILQSLHRFDGSRPFAAWVAGIARKTILRERRRYCQRQVTELRTPPAEPSPLEALLVREAQSHVRAAVRRLPPRYREVIELRYAFDLSPQEIGRRLATKSSTIRTRLARGQEILRQAFSAHGVPAGRTRGR